MFINEQMFNNKLRLHKDLKNPAFFNKGKALFLNSKKEI